MATLDDAFPSKYIKAADLRGNEVVVKITHVTTDEIDKKQKFLCWFAGKQKALVLNITNFKAIVKITGYDNTDDWTGAEICLYPTMTDYAGDQVAAIRIKAAPARVQQARPSSADMGRDDAPVPSRRPAPQNDMANDEIPF